MFSTLYRNVLACISVILVYYIIIYAHIRIFPRPPTESTITMVRNTVEALLTVDRGNVRIILF